MKLFMLKFDLTLFTHSLCNIYQNIVRYIFFWIQDLQNEIANKKITPKKQTPQKKTPKAGGQQFEKKAAGTPDKPSNAFYVISYS